VVDLTQTLDPEFPQISLPPELGQCWPFRIEEVSQYDERGPGWYWNNISCGEHTGTHFDAPIHWISGKDLPNNATDTIPPSLFVAHACVVDCSAEAAAESETGTVPTETDGPTGLLTLDEVQAEAERLNARWKGWAYELPSFKRDYIARRMDELTRALEETDEGKDGNDS